MRAGSRSATATGRFAASSSGGAKTCALTPTYAPTAGTRSTIPRIRFLVEDGSLIRCASHGALFDAGTGECVFGPCVGAALLALDTRVDANGMVFVTAPASLTDAGRIGGGPG